MDKHLNHTVDLCTLSLILGEPSGSQKVQLRDDIPLLTNKNWDPFAISGVPGWSLFLKRSMHFFHGHCKIGSPIKKEKEQEKHSQGTSIVDI